ncbi:hypothetical protein [Falsirhodobacter xinxiangensis]|uniref:hypothetical protein n=1 Tax=Falsirhodobacter xinxiangensis TaxID=2530049 RepID=UPI0010AA4874|nr:hypothetical protein [Rhodobacter xinxiangensis]
MITSQRNTLHFSIYRMVREKDNALHALYRATKGGRTPSHTMKRAAIIEKILLEDLVGEDNRHEIQELINELRTLADAGKQVHHISDDGYVSGGYDTEVQTDSSWAFDEAAKCLETFLRWSDDVRYHARAAQIALQMGL